MRSHLAGVSGHAAGVLIATTLACIAARGDGPPVQRAALPNAPAGPRTRVDGRGDPLPPGALVRFGTVRNRQETPIGQIVYSPDGRLVATDGDDPEIRIWDGREGRLLRRLEVGPALLRTMSFTPDSRTLAVASYRLDRDRLGYSVDISYARVDSGVRIVRGPWPEQDSVAAMALSLSPDPGLLATATLAGTLRLRDARDGGETGRFLIGRREIRRIAFAASGGRIAALSRDEGDPAGELQVDVFEPRRRAPVRTIPNIRSGDQVTLSADGNIVIISDKYLMECRDVASGQKARDGLAMGEDASFSADGRMAAVFNWPSVKIYDLATEGQVASFQGPSSRPTAWALSPDGATVATSGGPTALHFWDARTGRDRLATGEAHSEPVRCLLFSADGKTLVTGGDDRTIRVWDAATGDSRKVLNLVGKPRSLDLSPDGRWLVAGAEDQGWIFVWDLIGGGKPTILFERFNSEPYPLAVRYSGRDETILSAWSDGRLREWDRGSEKIRDRKPARFLEGSLTDIDENRRCRSGSFFAGAGRLGVIRREPGLLAVDMGSGRQVCELAGATIVAASPDGRTLAVAVQRDDPYFEPPSWKRAKGIPRRHPDAPDSEGATIVLLDGETGGEKGRVAVPGTTLWGLAFSPDSKTLAATCGRGRGQIRLYQVSTGGQVRSISAPPINGPCLAFSPDGSRLATAMADTTVLLWDLRPGP